MLLLLLLALLIYSNVRLAKRKGKNPLVWGIVTFIAFLLALAIFGAFYMALIYKGGLTQNEMSAYLENEPLTAVMVIMLGIGGALLVRFILERAKGSDVA